MTSVYNNRTSKGGEKGMSVKIRLARFGRKKAPYYRVVVADSRSPRDGRFIETLGIYQPLKAQTRVEIDEDGKAIVPPQTRNQSESTR